MVNGAASSAGAKISPESATAGAASSVLPETGLIAVLGAGTLALDPFYNVDQQIGRPFASHETTRLARVLAIDQLPDRWYGWQPFEALVWAGDQRIEPADLSPDQADAIRDYVRRGGHLIVVLPQRGDPWGIGMRDNVRTELSDLLPTTAPQSALLPMSDLLPLTKSNQIGGAAGSQLPRTLPTGMFEVKHFGDAAALVERPENHYQPLIALADGSTLALQRTYGHGHITVVSLDLSAPQLPAIRFPNEIAGIPQADVFWNRILGRRADAPSSAEVAAIRDADRLNLEGTTLPPGRLGRGGLMTGQIAMQQQGTIGLLLAFVLFALYWLVAGPLGYLILKQYKAVQYAWVAFAGCAGLFTAIAWGAVSLLPSVEHEIKHVTYLDHIARPRAEQGVRSEPQYQRAVSWFKVYLDAYGTTSIAIDGDANDRNQLFSWAAPGGEEGRFPNVDRYAIDVGRDMSSFDLPSRSTSTQMKAAWQGALPEAWGGMIRESEALPVTLVPDSGVGATDWRLRGTLRHDLPAELTNVSLIWVTNNRIDRPAYAESTADGMLPWVPAAVSGQTLNRTLFVRLSDSWRPGDDLDLESVFLDRATGRASPRTYFVESVKRRYTDEYQREIGNLTQRSINRSDERNFMEMLSFFHMLQPPNYLLTQPGANEQSLITFARELGREVDLSAWFNRPCLIIMGYLDEVEMPIPLRLGGRERTPSSEGRVMVRWIMPLPLDPKSAFAAGATSE